MTSWCPGVGVPSRRRREVKQRQYRLEDSTAAFYGGGGFDSSDMDESALLARRRLEQKLGYFNSSRSSSIDKKTTGGCGDNDIAVTNTNTKRRHWPFRSNSGGESRREVVCAVCLEEFKADQEVTNLSCSHKYHSKCLVPWLVSHPHCPCCRTPVQSP